MAKGSAENLEALRQEPRKALLERFEALHGRVAPPYLSQSILALAVAYRLQEQVHGGLKTSVRRQLMSGNPSPPARASAGTVLVREWHGRQHTVIVQGDGVEYAGERFRSLTEVVFRITGQKRSGPAFFGLRSRNGR